MKSLGFLGHTMAIVVGYNAMTCLIHRIMHSAKLHKVIMYLAFYTGVTNMFYFLNRGVKRIIVFHNVLPDAMFRDDMTNCASCSVSRFSRIIDMLRFRFKFSTDFDDSSTLTITFDDGLLNQYEVAGAILWDKGNIPAVIFTSGKALRARSPMECSADDQLLFWCAYAPQWALNKFRGEEKEGIVSRGDFWCKTLRPAYANDTVSRGRTVWKVLDEIYPFTTLYGALDKKFLRLRMTGLDEKSIADMKNKGWKLGWHTDSHFPLSALSNEEARKEIAPPSDDFKVVPFCYPYGEVESVSSRDIEIAKEIGYPMALNCSMRPEDDIGRFFHIRFTLPDNEIELHYILSGLKYFIESGQLLKKMGPSNGK